ncbi:hypothetical protein MMC17_007510 [Xylographa soralifera]|nr:hypothetical protein [Xylographa soralifera]
MVQQRPISQTTMAKLILPKVVPVPPEPKANRIVRWLYRAVFPEVTVHESENDTVYLNPSTILGTALWTHSDLILRETSGCGETGASKIPTRHQQRRGPERRLPFCCGPKEETEVGVSNVKDTSEHNNQLSTTEGCEQNVPQGLRLPDGTMLQSNTHLSFRERINSNLLIEKSVASYIDANMTSYLLAMKHDTEMMDIVFRVFRDLPTITNGEITAQAAHILSYDCACNQFVLRFFPERPETLEQLGREWHKAGIVLQISLASLVNTLHGRLRFEDECSSWMTDYGFQLCVLIEMGIFITDFLHVFNQQQYYSIDSGELWMIRPILKEWREKLVDLTRFPDMIFNHARDLYIGKHDKKIFQKTPYGKTKLLADYDDAGDIGLALRVKITGPLGIRECLRPRRARVRRPPPHSTRVPSGYCNVSPNSIFAADSGESTRSWQDRTIVSSDEHSLRLLQNEYKTLYVSTPCLGPLTPAQDGRSVTHEVENPKTKTDISGPLPSPITQPARKTNGDHTDANTSDDILEIVSELGTNTPSPSRPASPQERTSKHQCLGDDPSEDKDLIRFHTFSDPFSSTSSSHGEHISQKSGGSMATSNRRNNRIEVTFSTSKASQPLAIKTVNMRPAALLPKQSNTTTTARRQPSLHSSIFHYLHLLSKPESKAPAAPVSADGSLYSLQRRSSTNLCTSCENTADLHLLVNTRKNSLLGERYIITCFNIYSDYFDTITLEESWRGRAQFYKRILDNLDRRDGGHSDWKGCVESLRDRGADVDAIDEADARISDNLLDGELDLMGTADGSRKYGQIGKSVGFVDGPHPTRFVIRVRDGGVR